MPFVKIQLSLLCHAIFPPFPTQSAILDFELVNFTLDEYPWSPDISHSTKLKLKSSNYILVSSCCLSLFFRCCLPNLSFLVLQWPLLTWLLMAAKLLKSHQMQAKNLLEDSRHFTLKVLCDVMF